MILNQGDTMQSSVEFHHSHFNISETIDLIKGINAIITASLADDVYLVGQSAKAEEIISDIELLQGRSRINSLTDMRSSLDEDRDTVVQAFEYDVTSKMALKRFDMVKGTAAESIKTVFDATPISIRDSYSEESNQINTRIKKLGTIENQAHLTTMESTHLFEHLKSIQSEFEKVSGEKDSIESAKLRGTIREQKKYLIQRIQFILSYLESQAIDVPMSYETAMSEVTEVLNRISSQAKARATRKENTAQ